ncbi:dihydroneopterin aldolase [Reichenbachiella sp. MALMAid0571]|uniref:dihydroneopterin aldolase n=1 Tax=Reichenbachiella sp. MALMAid0571 TaxID=3143939 RepID=UPI0032DFA6ED
MGKIQLEGLEYFAHHGYHHEEQKVGNRYTVNITLFTDFGIAATHDDISGTVNYVEVYQIISGIMSENTKLLEHIAYKINKAILSKFSQVETVEVQVSKHNPPLKGICEYSSVTLSDSR